MTLTLIIVFGCLNALPWIILCFNRPDRQISNQLTQSDQALAQIFSSLMERVDFLMEAAPEIPENPLMAIVEMFLKQKFEGIGGLNAPESTISREDNGQFNGEGEAKVPEEKRQTILERIG